MKIFFNFFFLVFSLLVKYHRRFQKKNFLELLSIPTISKPFFEKNKADSEPTKPQEPVIKATLI